MEEKDIRMEIVSDDLIQKVIDGIKESHQYHLESKIDAKAVVEFISKFKGMNNVTAMCTVATSMLLLPGPMLLSLGELLQKATVIKMVGDISKKDTSEE